MAFPREPEQSYRPIPSDEEIRRRAAANETQPRPSRFDDELQPDLELTEGPAGPGRMAAYAIAALLIVGAVLYGMTRPPNDTASTVPQPPSTNTAANAPTPTSPPVRNVTPGPNSQSGMTTGAAPMAPTTPAPAPQNNPSPAPSSSGAK